MLIFISKMQKENFKMQNDPSMIKRLSKIWRKCSKSLTPAKLTLVLLTET